MTKPLLAGVALLAIAVQFPPPIQRGNSFLPSGVVTQMGTGTGTSRLMGLLESNVTAIGNVGTGTDGLMSSTVPANSLANVGQGIRVYAWGRTANNANAKTVAMTWGAQTIMTQALTVSIAGTWRIQATIIKSSSNFQDIFAELLQLSTIVHNQTITAGSQTDTAAIVISCTGTATADNDIVQEGMLVEFIH